MSNTTLSGVYAKIERAKQHVTEIERESDRILRLTRFAFDPDVQHGEHVYRVYDVPKVNAAFSAAVGDCIHNLRSALDHLAWQLVLLLAAAPSQ